MNQLEATLDTKLADQRTLVSFELGEQAFCVDIMRVREIRGWSGATPLPSAPGYVRGVINLRGVILPVIDLGARIGLKPVETSVRSVVIVVEFNDRLVGLLVDGVSGIAAVARAEIQPPPDIVCDVRSSVVCGMFLRDGRMFSEIALEHVAPDAAELARSAEAVAA